MRHDWRRLVPLGTVVVAALGTSGTVSLAGRTQALPDLAIPSDRLPATCRLAPPSISTASQPGGSERIQVLWTMQVPSDPWRGTTRALLADIRTRIYGMPMVPDGPPLGAADARRYHLKLADGVEEGFVAFYQQEPRPTVVTVYGLRFTDQPPAPLEDPRRRATPVRLGDSIVLVTGPAGPCLDAARAHLRSLAAPR